MPRYAASRQKACAFCSTSKTKCDRKPGQCTRCAVRGLSCSYPLGKQPEGPVADMRDHSHPVVGNTVPTVHGFSAAPYPLIAGESHPEPNPRPLNFPAALRGAAASPTTDLHCPIDADAIQNRWLNSYLAEPGQKQKHYSVSTTAFIYRMLNSYVGVMIRGHGIPPFIHTSQVIAIRSMPALSTCLTLVRMCDKPLPGSERVIVDTMQREMKSLYEQHSNYDDTNLFAAFQAHLVCCMVLFFRLNKDSLDFRRQAMMDLQTLACSSSRGGLVCVAETENTSAHPQWETWIIAEAKRRTLFTMYLFDSLLSAEEGIPTLIATELEGLPGPAARQLWTASTRKEWETAYNIYQSEWVQRFRIDELWPVPADLDPSGILARRSRVDRWLEDVDEYGTMLYAVTCSTHGV
ncbi:hypothetical protein IQ07DRAFT_271655 [Pyrenochaeta sp. DS3sAY3a]|nr:hypothetical protein IQ07DRAFT_271655 [Pyrenochaeta sp. DS3sAY3a]